MQNLIYLLFIIITTLSCKNDNELALHDEHQKSTVDKRMLEDTFTVHLDTVYNKHAPRRITRNIKLKKDGNLLIASYDDVIQFDGASFTPIQKPKNIESWYAFDALEDRMGNIWIASDQSGVFRIDSSSKTITNFTTLDGLGHNRNMCIYEDKEGTIWVGGQGGLSKYDGEKFINYTVDDGLSHNDVNTILQDSKGNLWIGTRGNAALYDGSTFSEIKNSKERSYFNVWSIIEDTNSKILLVDSSGLWQYENNRFTYILDTIWSIKESAQGGYWYTSMGARSSSALNYMDKIPSSDASPISKKMFDSTTMLFGMVEDPQGNLWIGGGDGIWLFNNNTLSYYTGKDN